MPQSKSYDANTNLQTTIATMVRDAVEHYSQYLARDQVEFQNMYYGYPVDTSWGDLTKIEGRSGAISTDIRDAVYHLMPSIMRVLMGSDTVVKFLPVGPEDAQYAEQESEIVDYILRKDNDGFRAIYSAVMDGLVRRVGWVKWEWRDGNSERRGIEYKGLSEMQAGMLQNSPEVMSFNPTEEIQDPQTGETLYNASVMRRGQARVRIMSVPPEEIVYSRGAVSIEEADVIAHVREVPASDIVAMGYDEDIVDGYKGSTNEYNHDTADGASLRRTRHRIDGSVFDSGVRDVTDDSQRPVLFSEVYAKADVDGDGIAELRMFHCIGDDYAILNGDGQGEVVDDIPLARFVPFMEPHIMIGLSVSDLVGDVQVKKSLIERAMDHSLARAIDPRLLVSRGSVSDADLASPVLNQHIRVRGDVNNSVRELNLQYLGDAAIQVAEYQTEKLGDRVGMTRASQGLDPSALQSSTSEAVSGTFDRSNEIKEMICRTLAETGMKDLYKGLCRTIRRNQDFVRKLRMDDGRYVEMDPRTWNIERDVEVQVGDIAMERRVASLMQIAAEQKEMLAQGSPLVSNVELGNTARNLAKALGYRNPTEFFRAWTPEDQQQMEQQQAEQAANAPPTPEEQLVEVERAKTMLLDLRERDKTAAELGLKEKEMEARYAQALDAIDAKGSIDLTKQRISDDTDVEIAHINKSARSQGDS